MLRWRTPIIVACIVAVEQQLPRVDIDYSHATIDVLGYLAKVIDRIAFVIGLLVVYINGKVSFSWFQSNLFLKQEWLIVMGCYLKISTAIILLRFSRAIDFIKELSLLSQVLSCQQESRRHYLIWVFRCQKILKLLLVLFRWCHALTVEIWLRLHNVIMIMVPLVCVCWLKIMHNDVLMRLKFVDFMICQYVAQLENVIRRHQVVVKVCDFVFLNERCWLNDCHRSD